LNSSEGRKQFFYAIFPIEIEVKIRNFGTLLAKMAEIEELYRTSVPVLSIVFVCAVNTKLASLCGLELSLQISMELTMQDIHDTEWMLN
jgi:hypothetical protein